MIVSLSLLAVFGCGAVLLLKFRALGPAAFLTVFFFGFFAAQTPAVADPLNTVIGPVADALSGRGN
ncbi:hypothetical protein [Streptomyces sp. YIM 98790]|uniref:hypothetical protein n=1 Tax=Streptomyces sp. YIM 98790 TaxID=2689077 RepID=UPI00140A5753|nr:hypothetical protein [Streptomyces sp. YIM 98790]